MDNFIVSARKYRPSTFKSVVGQASITTTLKNAIKSNHLAQAYLFCGPRGVGKTTCARIFAKTINCINLDDNTEPCNTCESCNSFNENRSYNIHELDAASNNSVEDIRNLIEQVRIPPQVGKYSIYIIDEVHMLSSQAFNAFLKTLEEPPAHAIFILATTEKHKIIPTILSRCQIFDFNRIRIDDTVEYLEYISKNENITYEIEGLNIIAQKADGAMRDALSIFDQVVSFSGSEITYQKVIDNLNVLDYDYYFRIVDSFLKNNISDNLLIFNEIIDKGFDAHHFINGLSEHLRNLLVSRDNSTLQLLEVGAVIRERYKEQANICSPDFIFEALQISNKCDISYRLSKNKRLHVELALIELCNITTEKKKPDLVESKNREKEVFPKAEKPKETKKDSSSNVSRDNTVKKHQPSIQIGKPSEFGSFSIKEKLTQTQVSNHNVKKAESKSDENEVVMNNNFTQEDLVAAWTKFSDTTSDRPRVFNTLTSKKPQLGQNTTVSFVVENKAQKNMMDEIRNELLGNLKRLLQNTNIKLQLTMNESKSEGNKLYTTEDRFKHLLSKNENLALLKQEFNLDIE
ncbi:MAG: DNA polymerase III subunit gamma/tau [Bacteroidales bacterium]|nr:DNA polymerase III subunit gamma/tau [Bacteroidales bacterium]